MRRFLLLLLPLVLAFGFWLADGSSGQGGLAQGADVPITAAEYDDWEWVAGRAEEALRNERASNAAFETLRQQVADWRARFHEATGVRAAQIETLEAQIAALGPPPEEGDVESDEIAIRRDELNAQLQELTAPVRRAEEAHARANGLVTQIDRLIRDRQQALLLERGPSPLNPVNILATLEDLRMVGRSLAAETGSAMRLSTDQTRFIDNLPTIVVLLAIAGILLLRGRHWFSSLAAWIVGKGSGPDSAYVLVALVSFGQFLMPVLGLIALVGALRATSMFGSKGEELLGVLPLMGVFFFAARWLGGQTFPRFENWSAVLDLSPPQRRRGRFYFSSLGILVALATLLRETSLLFALEQVTASVLAFPIIVCAGLCLAGISRLMMAGSSAGEQPHTPFDDTLAEADERGFLDNVVYLTGRICLIFAVIGPLLTALGYGRAGVYCTLAPGMSLMLLALIAFLQRMAIGLFHIFRRGDSERDGLIPVLFNFVIMLCSLPVFALIWGVRPADLTEFWSSLRDGFVFGDTTISPTTFVAFAAVFALGFGLTRLFQGVLRNSVLPRTSIETGAQKALLSGLGYVGIFLAALAAISVAGLDLSNLAIVAGALSVGVGFGLQNIVSNFVSGLILLIERPVTEGDWIEVGGVMGTVRKISVRATTVETFDRTNVVVPNSDFVTAQVTNWTRGSLSGRLILPVGVAYGTDTRRVAEILQEIAEEHPLVIVNPPPMVVFQGFGADSLDFEMRVILRDINFGLGTRTELNHRIAERFAEEGIEIPFAQRDIWLRNPEALRGSEPMKTPTGIVTTAPILPDSSPEFPSSADD